MQKFLFFVLNPHRHDGEAVVGGTSTETPANGSPAADAQVVYGKSDDQAASEPSSTPAEPTVDRSAEYARIKEQYKDLYEADFKSNLDRRMKTRDKEHSFMKAVVDPMMKYFGMKDMNALKAFIDSDIIPNIEGGYTAQAIEAEANDDGDTQAVSEVMPSAADLAEQGLALGDKLKAQGIEFDLKATLANETVTGFMKKGLSLEQAYMLAHHDDLLLQAATKAAEKQKAATIESIRTNGLNRVMEHASKPAPAVVHKADPNKFTNDDLDRIAEQVLLKGAKIRL